MDWLESWGLEVSDEILCARKMICGRILNRVTPAQNVVLEWRRDSGTLAEGGFEELYLYF